MASCICINIYLLKIATLQYVFYVKIASWEYDFCIKIVSRENISYLCIKEKVV